MPHEWAAAEEDGRMDLRSTSYPSDLPLCYIGKRGSRGLGRLAAGTACRDLAASKLNPEMPADGWIGAYIPGKSAGGAPGDL